MRVGVAGGKGPLRRVAEDAKRLKTGEEILLPNCTRYPHVGITVLLLPGCSMYWVTFVICSLKGF